MAWSSSFVASKTGLDEVHPFKPIACIAADDPKLRASLTETLRLMGFKTYETDKGGLALFIATEVKLSLLLVDVALRDMRGLDVIREARAVAPDARIIALSDGGRSQLPLFCELAHHAGAHATLGPPFSSTFLCAAVHQAWHDDGAHAPWTLPALAHRAPVHAP